MYHLSQNYFFPLDFASLHLTFLFHSPFGCVIMKGSFLSLVATGRSVTVGYNRTVYFGLASKTPSNDRKVYKMSATPSKMFCALGNSACLLSFSILCHFCLWSCFIHSLTSLSPFLAPLPCSLIPQQPSAGTQWDYKASVVEPQQFMGMK